MNRIQLLQIAQVELRRGLRTALGVGTVGGRELRGPHLEESLQQVVGLLPFHRGVRADVARPSTDADRAEGAGYWYGAAVGLQRRSGRPAAGRGGAGDTVLVAGLLLVRRPHGQAAVRALGPSHLPLFRVGATGLFGTS